ncbi:chemotaxis protein MotC [Methylobacterium sp. J-090]|uniref:chemotaxis protein MotC n=1 Tax=Methylobacterium sp. J-090 TaxID=2836666 RepID=UPI001FBB1D07|nr:chemotaxis protein MotC [Methylobacterium sp. J-090]MCJ2083925.1 chemotaxis protein MotC [Methylobacterium sp. J-090]
MAQWPSLAVLALSMSLVAQTPARAAESHGGGHEAGGHAAAPAAPIEPLPVKPYTLPVEMVRTLQLLQDRIAQGSGPAHTGQRALLAHAEERMRALEPEAWADPVNIRAAVTFALGGGGPALLRHILASSKVPADGTPLVLGSLAFLEGREKEARTLLTKIDAASLPVGLGAQLALTQSALVVRDDPAQSIRLLDLARLLAPGTLVEEGALRREIFVLAQGNDLAKFEALAVQYLRRFRHSVYAGNFRQRFAAALTRLDFGTDSGRFARLQAMLDEIEPEGRRDLYLLMARAALDQGKNATAVFAAERTVTLTEPGTVAAVRARLYRAAALVVVDGRFEESVETLRMTDRSVLVPADRDLLDAALATAREIRDVPGAPGTPPSPEPPRLAARELPTTPAIARAQGVIGQIDDLMRKSGR